MDATAFYPSRWLKADDIGEHMKVKVLKLTKEEVQDETVPVLHMTAENQKLKPLILNRTNSGTMIELFGKETDNWIGKEIELFTVPMPSATRGRAIRIRLPQ
ncbi:MAG: hypothetical protein AB1486_18635 [Planctomycetota bacterium]